MEKNMELRKFIKTTIREYLNEQEKLKHDASYYDENNKKIQKEIEFTKFGIDDELTIYYADNVDKNLIKSFLNEFNKARKKIEDRFKMKLGREYKDPDASYKIWFGQKIVFDNKSLDKKRGFDNTYHNPVAEYVRANAAHAPRNSFYFNLAQTDSFVDNAKKDWISNPNYKNLTLRTYNVRALEDMIIHEIAHALYFQQPMIKRKEWKKYYDDGGWENATSMYGQENDMEMFAETIVDIINNEEHQITKDLIHIFNF